jgi:uncharacterized protein YggT (Ycf19 family)
VPSGAPAPGPAPAGAPTDDTKLWILRVARWVVLFVYAVVIVNLVLLSLGFALRLFGASTEASFTRWVYRNVDRIMEPFRGMFPTQPISDRSVLDVSLLFAMVVYAIVGLALHALVVWLAARIAETQRRERHRRLVVAAAYGEPGPDVVDPALRTYPHP